MLFLIDQIEMAAIIKKYKVMTIQSRVWKSCMGCGLKFGSGQLAAANIKIYVSEPRTISLCGVQ